MAVGHTKVFDCDEMQARELLVIARKRCPGAVRKIIEAMFMAGLILQFLTGFDRGSLVGRVQ